MPCPCCGCSEPCDREGCITVVPQGQYPQDYPEENPLPPCEVPSHSVAVFLPAGLSPNVQVSFKTGYPQALTSKGCTLQWYVAMAASYGTYSGEYGSGLCCGRIKYKYSLYMCDGKNFKDVTSQAVEIRSTPEEPVPHPEITSPASQAWIFQCSPGNDDLRYPVTGLPGWGNARGTEYCFVLNTTIPPTGDCMRSCSGCNAPPVDEGVLNGEPSLSCESPP